VRAPYAPVMGVQASIDEREMGMAKMRAVQVGKKGGPLELIERDLPEPGPGEVRVRVQACGVCHSDSVTKEGLLPSVSYPVVPGHEIAGVIDASAATLSIAVTCASPVSPMTAAMPRRWWRRPMRWR